MRGLEVGPKNLIHSNLIHHTHNCKNALWIGTQTPWTLASGCPSDTSDRVSGLLREKNEPDARVPGVWVWEADAMDLGVWVSIRHTRQLVW